MARVIHKMVIIVSFPFWGYPSVVYSVYILAYREH
jgi:hypothetical protein